MNQAANVQRAKGPLVWLDMDQKAPDYAYDQAVYAPNRDQVHLRNIFNSNRVRARLGEPKRIAYGPKPIEQFDLFVANKPNAPINVFVHGGAWRARQVKDYAFLAEMIVRAGGHWIGLDFDGVEGTKGDLLPMADQVRRAIAFVYSNAKNFGGDPNRIYIAGHSAGAAHVGTYAFQSHLHPADGPGIAGCILLSGTYAIDNKNPPPNRIAYYGEDLSLFPQRQILNNITRADFPVFISVAELDPVPTVKLGYDLASQLIAVHKRQPYFKQVLGHNHYSEMNHLGTGDDSIGPDLIDFIDNWRH